MMTFSSTSFFGPAIFCLQLDFTAETLDNSCSQDNGKIAFLSSLLDEISLLQPLGLQDDSSSTDIQSSMATVILAEKCALVADHTCGKDVSKQAQNNSFFRSSFLLFLLYGIGLLIVARLNFCDCFYVSFERGRVVLYICVVGLPQ